MPRLYWASEGIIFEVTLGYGTYPKAVFGICQVETHKLCNYFSKPAVAASPSAAEPGKA